MNLHNFDDAVNESPTVGLRAGRGWTPSCQRTNEVTAIEMKRRQT
jgi:hypothetical protein